MSKKVTRPVDLVLEEYSRFHSNSKNQLLQYFSIPLILFGLLGIIWAIPFPHLSFIEKYNGFVNWASFVIAFSIYYYYRLSPVLSYGILLFVFALSAGIVTLEKLARIDNWPPMETVCFFIFIFGGVLQYIGYKAEGKFPGANQSLKNLLNSPLWLIFIIFKKVGLKV